MDSGFRDTDRFSKLPYLGIKLGHWPMCQMLHIWSLSTSGGRNWAYFHSTGSGFRDTGRFSKLPYLGMKLAKWPKFQKLHIYTPFVPQRVKIELIFALREAVSKIQADFQNCHIWAWNSDTIAVTSFATGHYWHWVVGLVATHISLILCRPQIRVPPECKQLFLACHFGIFSLTRLSSVHSWLSVLLGTWMKVDCYIISI